VVDRAREPVKDDGALRHIVLVGGTPADWDAFGEHAWSRRLAELGKVAEHVGASWLVLRPYSATSTDPVPPTRRDVIAGCTVVAAGEADGRARLVDAVERLRLDGADITETSLARALNEPAVADPDLVVVLGPSYRLPPSLVWELAYSELVFIDVDWAELQPAHLEQAVDTFAHRHRRFGGLD
jgi:undecaprenyl diphosphate synthase